jgi:sulfide dehydrogenase cytochrome subunit
MPIGRPCRRVVATSGERSVQFRFIPTFAAALAATAVAQVAAATDAARDLAATCAGCHGTRGASRGTIPSLAGMEPEVLIAQMREFATGTRPGTVMPQLARGYTDREIESIAAVYAARKAPN